MAVCNIVYQLIKKKHNTMNDTLKTGLIVIASLLVYDMFVKKLVAPKTV